MDLISRKAVMDEINSLTITVTGLRAGRGVLHKFAEEYKKSVLRILDEARTAYDTGKVVEDIKMLRHPYTSFPSGYGDLNAYDFYIDKAIDAVKKGGLEE